MQTYLIHQIAFSNKPVQSVVLKVWVISGYVTYNQWCTFAYSNPVTFLKLWKSGMIDHVITNLPVEGEFKKQLKRILI